MYIKMAKAMGQKVSEYEIDYMIIGVTLDGKSRISNQAYWLNLVSFTGHHWQLFAVANSHDASINSNGVCSANYTLI